MSDKHDAGKERMSLVPSKALKCIVGVFEYGAAKYAVDAWRDVPDARRRYYDATQRHVQAWWMGEFCDKESGLPHLAHAAACMLILMSLEMPQ
jgi:hypothetical protein